jgi:hypothetical protein
MSARKAWNIFRYSGTPPADPVSADQKTIGGAGFCGYEDATARLKHVAGTTTDSLRVMPEAAHSVLDLVATAVTYFSVRAAERPDDG